MFLLVALAILALIVALPVVAASPSSAPGHSDKAVSASGEKAPGPPWAAGLVANDQGRAAGKPPWAGGWKRVGKAHPGWSQAKEDRLKAKFGDCFPPGQCKDKAEGDQ
jgi:hypothetical protein